MKYLAMLKSIKGLPNVLPKLSKGSTETQNELPKPPKAHYDSYDSSKREHLLENIPPMPRPYQSPDGGLVIPFDCNQKYHWWAGGQSVKETVKELKDAFND